MNLLSNFAFKAVLFLFFALFFFYLLISKHRLAATNKKLKNEIQPLKAEFEKLAKILKNIDEENSQKQNRLYSLLLTISDLAQELNSNLEEKKVLKVIAEKLKSLLEAKCCAIFEFDSTQKKLQLSYSFGYPKENLLGYCRHIDKIYGTLGWSLKNRSPVFKDDLRYNANLESLPAKDLVPICFSQPLYLEKKVIGIIIADGIKKEINRSEMFRFFSAISHLGSVALSNSRLMARFKDLSQKDSLTGLYNYTYFQTFLNHQIAYCSKEKASLAVIILDIDDFKKINDTFGHLAGDEVVRKLSEKLKEFTRQKQGLAFRYGGDEFALVLTGLAPEETYNLAETIREKIFSQHFTFNQKTKKITLSLGINYCLPRPGQELNKNLFINLADNNLYKAKTSGKNKTVISVDSRPSTEGG